MSVIDRETKDKTATSDREKYEVKKYQNIRE